jgi:RimJ/RimL family protein N-acetyltransferase
VSLTVRRHGDAASFLARAEDWLLAREAEHNLILGIAYALRSDPRTYDGPVYLATVESGGIVVGCGWRTPPFKFGITRMPDGGPGALAIDAAEVVDTIPAVLGAEPEAVAFAEAWRRLRGGGAAHICQRNRIYQLDRVVPPARPAPGFLREAEEVDEPLLASWMTQFAQETGVHSRPGAAARWIARRRAFVWEDGEPVSLAAVVATTPHGVRIGGVFTPPALRGRGYASACVAELSGRMLAAGRRFCFLYTDLANPTSNAIYVRIGYRPVCDVVDVCW